MRTPPILPERERALRIEATAPGLDVWVAANAGSGKTTILRNRVIRLLLDDVPADRILCLTFTKAAAAEMQARVFAELARWVNLDDAALTGEIAALGAVGAGAPRLSAVSLAGARTLFARAMETPGGLRIQTIHAFAERVLHLFPLESGVPVDFSVLGDADARDLREAARKSAVEAAIEKPASPLGKAFGEILAATGTEGFSAALDAALGALSSLRMRDAGLPPPETREALYRAALGVPQGETLAAIEDDFAATALAPAVLHQASEAIGSTKKPSDKQLALAANFAAAARLRETGGVWQPVYLKLFLTEEDEARKRVFVGDVLKRFPELREVGEAAKAGSLAYLARRRAFLAFTRSLALSTFAEAVHTRFTAGKQARNALDFDDLITALRRMLAQGQANWMMMKLDAAVEHVLIDEAQDTTAPMWDIVRGLTDDFFSGAGRARRPRSIFVVGDEKQSIFSFQGANPVVFEESRRYFAEKSLAPRHVATPVALNYSFRSSDDILGAVDAVFAEPSRAAGLTALPLEIRHIAARQNFAGLVELWPLIRPPDEQPEGVPQASAPVLLAEAIASTIGGWLANGERHLDDGRPVRPGDIVILVPRRNAFFAAMLRALKLRGIPVAGADRLKLQDEIAVRDLLVIAEALMTEDDDLALATALKTPLFGVSDLDLERLARARTGSLSAALGEAGGPPFAALAARIAALRVDIRRQSPLEFFAALLTDPAPASPELSGRQAMLRRLGLDAADPIDEFLLEAEAFARRAPPSVALFVREQRGRETEIKRDLDQGGDRVRIMTVHGAKGLEGRIVFLGDTAETPNRGQEAPAFLLDPPGSSPGTMPLLVWAGVKNDEPEVMRTARQTHRRAQLAEYRRLFYVAMTRAADRLYIAGYTKKRSKAEIESGLDNPPPEDPLEWSWYQLAEAGLAGLPNMVALPAPGEAFGGRPLRRLVSAVAAAPPAPMEPMPPAGDDDLPGWLRQPPPDEPARAAPLSPSRAGFAAAPESTARAAVRTRGLILHRLYELLPSLAPDARIAAGRALVAAALPGLPPPEIEAMVASVNAILASAEGARYFGPQSRPEVAIAGPVRLGNGAVRDVAARLDRLIVRPEAIEVLDIKTGSPRPDAQDTAILRQMALYRALLRALYPGKPVTVTLLWAAGGSFETLPDAALDAALDAITAL